MGAEIRRFFSGRLKIGVVDVIVHRSERRDKVEDERPEFGWPGPPRVGVEEDLRRWIWGGREG